MTSKVEGAGVELAVREYGPADGRPVLLVHGLASDAEAWAAVARELAAEGLRVVAYDRRGYGGSGAPAPYTGTTVAEQAADALALLDGLGLDAALVAGDGFGALVALDLAMRFPARVTALVCVDPPLFLFVPDAAQALAAERLALEEALRDGGPAAAVAVWLGDGAGEDPGRRARAEAAAAACFADYAGLATLTVTRRALRAVAMPARVVTGPDAEPVVAQAADALATLLPEGRREHAGTLAGAVRALAA